MSVNPLRGAVRNIVTPKRGRRRIHDLDSFEDKGHYVALARGERFKPMTYVPEAEVGANGSHAETKGSGASPTASPRKPMGSNRVVLEPILPVVHNKKLMSVQPRFGAKMDVISSQSKAIRVYRNGDEFTPAIIVMLRPSEQVSMEVVLRAVEERVVLPNNMAIRKLFDISGRRIREPQELQHEKHYVAGGHEPFLSRPYGQKLPLIVLGKAERKSTIKYLSQPITPEKHSSRKSKQDSQRDQAQQNPRATNSEGGGATKLHVLSPLFNICREGKGGRQIQASIRGFETRKVAAEKRTGGPSSVKGFEARKQAASKVAQRPIELKNDAANSKKQKQQQQPQKQQKPMSEEEKAAAKSIQASVNSYKTRKQVLSNSNSPVTSHAGPGQQQHKHATTYRAEQYDGYEDPMYHQAATKIQATYRGYRSRKQQRLPASNCRLMMPEADSSQPSKFNIAYYLAN
uniref:Doublecortin domain-containing protein n=1 Tax=Macrostomum lignano TaxID=282301 RepID=A0A1I8ID92_9PLAT